MKLTLDPDPILKQRAVEWNFSIDTNAEEVEQEMIKIMESFRGRGLAGNQVSLLKRVFVIKLESTGQTVGMFNPEIVKQDDMDISAEEGCLSFPNLWLDVKRPKTIDIKYFDKQGTECIMSLSGIDARCFLHELDHLNGITFTDKVSQMKLILARKKQRKIKW
jgi:peptide deformylase